jgi:hypothetical protein
MRQLDDITLSLCSFTDVLSEFCTGPITSQACMIINKARQSSCWVSASGKEGAGDAWENILKQKTRQFLMQKQCPVFGV